MSHFGDFMDDVPVKISEKYKRHPRIYLPYTVNECIIRAQGLVESVNATNYSCTFERNVLSKLKELRNAKETKKNERRHRLQLLQEAEQKRLDALAAAEEEERLKQLSVSEVSYPSTDEISALSPDEKVDKNCDNPATVDVTSEHVDVSTTITLPSASVATETQPNILQPIQVNSHYTEGSLLDQPDPLRNFKLTNKITRMSLNPNVDTLTYKDFEHDTSSPFDNVELNTINDMELLAQVLQSQKNSASSCPVPSTYVPEQQGYPIPNCASQAQIEGTSYLPNNYLEQPIQGPSMMYDSPQHYPMTNGYYLPTDTDNMYNMPNYQYYAPSNPYPNIEPYYGSQLPATSDISQVPDGSTYIPQPYYYQYPQVPFQYQGTDAPNYSPVANENAQNYSPIANENTEATVVTSHNAIKSRSRSVPDIVRELNEELTRLKMDERSYNASPALKNTPQPQVSQPQPSTANVQKVNRSSKTKSERLHNPFQKLPLKTQEMCRKIHGMGFPLDRVARLCTLVGDNDKKVIECLLIVGELMDLGFSEDKVSAALLKHQFNRDQALDELVS